jgi:signal transduction histidine kinase
MTLANKVASFPKTREWTSFRGSAVPLGGDAFAVAEDFVRALHHRLCQPLTALSCTLELMQVGREADTALSEQLRSAVEQADQIIGMMAMFRQLFEAAPSTGDCSSSLPQVVADVVEDLRPVADHDQIVLVLEVRSNAKVMMEESRLRQLLWTLLQNCIELTPERGLIKVRIESLQLIVDDGCVASLAEIANIFDPFSFCAGRNHSLRVSNLLLAVLQRAMASNGGNISVLSTKEGRRFELRFPRGQDS